MAENFGGPVWHASGRGRTTHDSKRIAFDGLAGAGDRRLGQWIDLIGSGGGVVHVVRRMSSSEREQFAVPDPYDIRGTPEETRRIMAVYAEAPYLVGRMP